MDETPELRLTRDINMVEPFSEKPEYQPPSPRAGLLNGQGPEFGPEGFKMKLLDLDKENPKSKAHPYIPSFPIHYSEVGYVNTYAHDKGNVRQQIPKGEIGRIDFSLELDNVVCAFDLAWDDHEFHKYLLKSERKMYNNFKENYKGGLNIPMLTWLGANLDNEYRMWDMQRYYDSQKNFTEKVTAVQNIFRRHMPRKMKFTGDVWTEGFEGRRYQHAFVRVARVWIGPDKEILVVSIDPTDVWAGFADGTLLLSVRRHIENDIEIDNLVKKQIRSDRRWMCYRH